MPVTGTSKATHRLKRILVLRSLSQNFNYFIDDFPQLFLFELPCALDYNFSVSSKKTIGSDVAVNRKSAGFKIIRIKGYSIIVVHIFAGYLAHNHIITL